MDLALQTSSLHKLQTYQKKHDQEYHGDISILPHPQQLAHFTFHFHKYARRLTRRGRQEGWTLAQTIEDSFIIVLATSNLLNLDLGVALENAGPMPQVPEVDQSNIASWLMEELVDHAGLMSKACEGLDHMEGIDYRAIAKTAIVDIARALIYAVMVSGIELKKIVLCRWQYIEAKQIL